LLDLKAWRSVLVAENDESRAIQVPAAQLACDVGFKVLLALEAEVAELQVLLRQDAREKSFEEVLR
jgi:hypothetical protein